MTELGGRLPSYFGIFPLLTKTNEQRDSRTLLPKNAVCRFLNIWLVELFYLLEGFYIRASFDYRVSLCRKLSLNILLLG